MAPKGRPKKITSTVTEIAVVEPKKTEKRVKKIVKENEEIVEKKPRKNAKKVVKNGSIEEVPVAAKTTGRKASKKEPKSEKFLEQFELPVKVVKTVENNGKRSRKKVLESPVNKNTIQKEKEIKVKRTAKPKIAATENGRKRVPKTAKPEKNGKENARKTTAAASKKTVSSEKGRKRAAHPPDVKKSKMNKNHIQDETSSEDDYDDEFDTEEEEVPKKKSRKTEKEKQPSKKSSSTATKVNATKTNYDKIDFSLDKEYNLKISSWNVAGLRSWLQKGGHEFIEHEKPDIFCLQEIKCSQDQIPDEARFPGYHPYWLCNPGGYAGVALYSKIMPNNVEYGIGDEEQDADGRILTAEYEKFYLVVVYVPNSGRGLVTLPKRMRWNKIFHEYLCKLSEKKSVIIAGDMNVSHKEIDLANPKTNKKSAGFTQEERDGMSELLSLGFMDTFRHFYPELEKCYTYWTYMANARSRNVGWRLDYFIVSERLLKKCVDNVIRSGVLGSDHCPITLFLKI